MSTYTPQLVWTPTARTASAVCLNCRWTSARTTTAAIRAHALANRGHEIVMTTRAETLIAINDPVSVDVPA